jgi:hypothetical protein
VLASRLNGGGGADNQDPAMRRAGTME